MSDINFIIKEALSLMQNVDNTPPNKDNNNSFLKSGSGDATGNTNTPHLNGGNTKQVAYNKTPQYKSVLGKSHTTKT